jgi:hypothetical protein
MQAFVNDAAVKLGVHPDDIEISNLSIIPAERKEKGKGKRASIVISFKVDGKTMSNEKRALLNSWGSESGSDPLSRAIPPMPLAHTSGVLKKEVFVQLVKSVDPAKMGSCKYGPDGFNEMGINREGYSVNGVHVGGYDADGYDVNGFDRSGKDRAGQFSNSPNLVSNSKSKNEIRQSGGKQDQGGKRYNKNTVVPYPPQNQSIAKQVGNNNDADDLQREGGNESEYQKAGWKRQKSQKSGREESEKIRRTPSLEGKGRLKPINTALSSSPPKPPFTSSKKSLSPKKLFSNEGKEAAGSETATKADQPRRASLWSSNPTATTTATLSSSKAQPKKGRSTKVAPMPMPEPEEQPSERKRSSLWTKK